MACTEAAGDGFLEEALAGAGDGAFVVAKPTLGFRLEVLGGVPELEVGDGALEILFIFRSKSFKVIFFFLRLAASQSDIFCRGGGDNLCSDLREALEAVDGALDEALDPALENASDLSDCSLSKFQSLNEFFSFLGSDRNDGVFEEALDGWQLVSCQSPVLSLVSYFAGRLGGLGLGVGIKNGM